MKTLNKPIETDLYPYLSRWTMPPSYFGATWEGYYGSGFGRSRESSCLEESNFSVVQRELAKLPPWTPPDDFDDEAYPSRYVVRESHWAVGWVEWIAIHESDQAALELCNRLAGKSENYPPLDDEHWRNLEDETAQRVWKDCYDERSRIKYIRDNPSQFDFNDFADLLGCVRGKYFLGYASELIGE